MRIRVGNGGWYRVDGDLGLSGRVYFRIQEVDGAPRLTELYVDGRGEPLQAGALRKLPLPMLEHWAARAIEGSEVFRARLSVPGPDLSRLAAYFATTFGKAQHWVADSMRDPQPPMPRDDLGVELGTPEPIRLESPPDGRLTDNFLRDVARAYDAAIANRQAPAKALAASAGVEPRTVQSWVYKARKRGLMPPAETKGRVV